jgi:DNA helicase-4
MRLGGFRHKKAGDFFNSAKKIADHHAAKLLSDFNNNDAMQKFDRLLKGNSFIRQSDLNKLSFPSLEDNYFLSSPLFFKFSSRETQEQKKTVLKKLELIRHKVDNHNSQYIQREIDSFSFLFEGLESYPLTKEQQKAIVNDEDANLIVAGAGTGKTSVVIGKVAYLLAKQECEPDDILLLAFSNKAAKELKSRIHEKLNLPKGQSIQINTFHSFGLKVLAQSLAERPVLSEMAENPLALRDFLNSAIEKMFSSKDTARKLIRYFAYYLEPEKSEFDFQYKGQHIEYLKEYDIATLKDIFQNPPNGQNGRYTLKRELVKSKQECSIANFLFLNNIEYEYERPYPYAWREWEKGSYRPDFYLPDFDIYIEHFGVDKKNKTAPFIDNEQYLQSMQKKRLLHKELGTTLLETYSYELWEDDWEGAFKKKLEAQGVKLFPMSEKEFQEKIIDNSSLTNKFFELLANFLNLYKSSRPTIAELRSRAEATKDKNRTNAFLDVFEEILSLYENHLAANNEIDFNDMIIKAKEIIDTARIGKSFKYIIIDEYQDISFARYQLVKSLLKTCERASLTAVGDDWQSIYRFTGADVSLMSNFQTYWGYHDTLQLTETFRYPQELLDFSSDFIQQNPKQIPKKLKSSLSAGTPCVNITIYESKEKITETLDWILKQIRMKTAGEQATVFILGRYNSSKPEGLLKLTRRFPSMKIRFHTVHAAKGLEADYVILLDLNSGKHGFPCTITNDPLIEFVLAEPDGYEHSEERRLFYVAVTRARKEVFLCAPINNRSAFIREIDTEEADLNKTILAENTYLDEDSSFPPEAHCPRCKTGTLVKRNGPRGRKFIGCTNYPYCTYTQNIE